MDASPLPPQMSGLPLIGNALAYLRDPFAFLGRVVREHGDVVRVRFATLPFTLVSHPDVVEQVLVVQAKSFHKDRFGQTLKAVLGEGLLISEGDVWRRQRRLANPAFHKERIAAYGQIMVDLASRAVGGWRDGDERDVHKDMMRLTLEIVAKTLFGADVAAVADEVGEALHDVLEHFTDAKYHFLPLLRRLPTPAMRRFPAARARLDEVIFGFVRARRAAGDAEEAPTSDLLSMLLHARDADGTRMSDDQLRDEVMTLFLAGHETTAIALTWTWLLLARNPEVERRLHASLTEALDGRAPTLADLPRLKYAAAVIDEAMRLYPPAWSIGREAMEDVVLGGFAIPKGTQVWINPWTIHRDPRWFDAPEEFRPERWLDGSLEALPKYAYFPFGGGPRICIGLAFARMEAILLLAAIAREVKLHVLPDQKIEPMASVTLRPRHGLRVRVERRAP
ncbi:MAG: cytochrome P450 [Polyangiales bacterium]